MSARNIILVAHNVRSCHNVGSLLRTADGLGVDRVILSGYTPHPARPHDRRLPHEVAKITRQIEKTALGAERTVNWQWHHDILPVLDKLKAEGYAIAALEQTDDAKPLPMFHPPIKTVLIVGREVEGIEPEVLQRSDICLEIPMYGQKESYNVAQAAAMALYHLRFA